MNGGPIPVLGLEKYQKIIKRVEHLFGSLAVLNALTLHNILFNISAIHITRDYRINLCSRMSERS